MNLITLLDMLTEKAVLSSPLDQSPSKLTHAIQKFVTDCLSFLAGGLDILREKLIVLERGETILVGSYTDKKHIWLSRCYSLFCGRKKIKQDCFSKPFMPRVLLKRRK